MPAILAASANTAVAAEVEFDGPHNKAPPSALSQEQHQTASSTHAMRPPPPVVKRRVASLCQSAPGTQQQQQYPPPTPSPRNDDNTKFAEAEAAAAAAAAAEDSSNNRVRVLCRFRRCLDGEADERAGGGWLYFDDDDVGYGGRGYGGNTSPETVSVRMGISWSRRAFDKVFRPGVSQAEVYDAVELVAHGVAQGFNGTIFAYGQTGSGKTYTMGGAESTLWSSSSASVGVIAVPPAEAGVIPRAVTTVLADANARREEGWEFVLTATYVEIYNEKIRDLLEPSNDNLKVSEHPARGVEAVGATEVRVSTLEEAVGVLRDGARHRMTAATLMNEVSSRSHSIFTLRLDQRDVVRDCKVSGRLTLVDLAGSERAGKTGAEGRRLEEANSINVSLHTLGRVIRALSETASHVPFRDSKLTRLLQESLGGNSRTVLVVCCSPEEAQAQETLSTLKFGECAKRVSTFASANVVAAPNEVAAQLSELRAEVVRLKRQLHNAQLREAKRYEGTPSGRRLRRASAAPRGGFVSPGGMMSPSGNSASDVRAQGVRGTGRVGGGSGPLCPKRWGTSPLNRGESFNASFTAGDGSGDDESWTGRTARDWDQDAGRNWTATGANDPSPSATPRWLASMEPRSPLVVSPAVSPGATPVLSRRGGGGGGGGSRKGKRLTNQQSRDDVRGRRLWSDSEHQQQHQDDQDHQKQQHRHGETEYADSAISAADDGSPPSSGTTSSGGARGGGGSTFESRRSGSDSSGQKERGEREHNETQGNTSRRLSPAAGPGKDKRGSVKRLPTSAEAAVMASRKGVGVGAGVEPRRGSKMKQERQHADESATEARVLSRGSSKRRQMKDLCATGSDDDHDDDRRGFTGSGRQGSDDVRSATQAVSAAGSIAAAAAEAKGERGGLSAEMIWQGESAAREKTMPSASRSGLVPSEERGDGDAQYLRVALARLKYLENSWKDRISEYEKLLQLKDLRIQSLMSVYKNGSTGFREAVTAQMVDASASSDPVADDRGNKANIGGYSERSPFHGGGTGLFGGRADEHGERDGARRVNDGGESDSSSDSRGATENGGRRVSSSSLSSRRALFSLPPPPPPSPERSKKKAAVESLVVYTDTDDDY